MDDNGGTDRGPRDWVQRLIARTNRNRHDERANSRAARLARFTRVVEKIDQEIDADDDPLQQAIKNSIAKLPSARALKSTEPPKLRNLRLRRGQAGRPIFPVEGLCRVRRRALEKRREARGGRESPLPIFPQGTQD